MTDDELTQFATLAKKYERVKDKEKVLALVSADMHEVFQEINDRGHSAATKAKQADIDKLSGDLTEFKTRAETAEGKLKSFDDKAPDVAKVRETYENAEKALRQEYDKRIQDMTVAQDTALKSKDEALVNVRFGVVKRDLVSKMADSKFGVDKEYAETILVEKPDVKSRIKVDADGSVKVLKKGSTDMFIAPAEGKSPLDHLAEELSEGVEAKWKVSGNGRGSATRGSEGGSAGNGSLSEKFDATRARVAESAKAAAAAKTGGSALERLGSSRR